MERLREYVAQWNITLSDTQLTQFQHYYEMLVETNKVMNLTAITERSEVIVKHFMDSLAIVKVFPKLLQKEKMYLLDVGTGAGFPGIPLKIAFPQHEILLLDSLNKRVKFLNTVIEGLELCDISAIHARAEEAARNQSYRESFDICVSRAVANLSALSEYCIPFVKKGGYFIPYKSGNIEQELIEAKKAIAVLGGKAEAVKSLQLPASLEEKAGPESEQHIERSFILIRKAKETPKAYPRKAGTATKNPI